VPIAAKHNGPRRATNVSLNQKLVEEAKLLGVNLSQACERGLRDQVAETRAEKWQRENLDAINASNEYADKNGLPLSKQRLF
jgi:antitoxin CcdA